MNVEWQEVFPSPAHPVSTQRVLLGSSFLLRPPTDATASQAQLHPFRHIASAPQMHPGFPSVLARQLSPLSCSGVFSVRQSFYRSGDFSGTVQF